MENEMAMGKKRKGVRSAGTLVNKELKQPSGALALNASPAQQPAPP
jgi:hypothetical protein